MLANQSHQICEFRVQLETLSQTVRWAWGGGSIRKAIAICALEPEFCNPRTHIKLDIVVNICSSLHMARWRSRHKREFLESHSQLACHSCGEQKRILISIAVEDEGQC